MPNPARRCFRSPVQRVSRSSRRGAARRLIAETLEDRRLLAVTTEPLNGDNDVVFRGDSNTDTVTFSVVDGFLEHNLAGRPGFDSSRDLDSTTPGDQALRVSQIGSLSFLDSGQNDRATFNGAEPFEFATAALNFSVGRITVSPGVNVSTTSG
ncbi:MAG TPA: hypothetical protein DDW52_11970, partial [Planctomycetaceae bacterium]|nr:hypothetical protein [Planctomycetaceae bacterium]